MVNGAFFGAAAGAFGDEASVVGGIPKEGILVNLKVAEGFAEFADLFVEEGDFLKVSGVFFSFVEFRIGGGFAMGIVRRGEPDHGKGGFALGVFFEVFDGAVHGDDGALAFVLSKLAVLAEIGIAVEEVESGEPVVKSLSSGRSGAFFLDRADVPLAEVGSEIAI